MDKLRVLITDDEMGMRLGVARTLRDFCVRIPDVDEEVRFVVDQAESGEEALEKIAQQRPDILLLDHKMPGISGLEVLDRLAGMQNEMLTIMITAYASIETAVSATKRGAYDFLAKPFTPDELKSTIRKASARLVLAKHARKLAEEKQQVRFEFISVLAHELKSPLNAVAGYLQMLADDSLADEPLKQEMIARSMARIEGMKKLIADLLDLTRIESGKRLRRMAEVNLHETIKKSWEIMQNEAVAKEISLHLDVDREIFMLADPDEIEMLMNNLISNAIKYNCQGGRVDIAVSADEKQVKIVVSDTGIGMTQEELSRIFTEFGRIKNEKTNNILGSGLGLSIVKKLVQLYDGEVRVESQPDKGSTFTIVLKRN